MRVIVPAALVAAICWLPAAASSFELYHSPADDGVNPGAPGVIPISGGNKTLFLYVDNGIAATPSDPCAGTGVGDEVCMWDLNIVCDPNVTIVSFTGDPGASVVANPQAAFIRMNGGEPLAGTLGPAPVGELVVSATGTGDCNLVGEAWVDTGLAANATPATVVASACNDNDTDDLCNPVDPCIDFNNAGPGGLTDTNTDGIPDVCQCGDANGDGFLTITDAFAAATCATNPACAEGPVVIALWDTNDDGFLTITDAFNDAARGSAGTQHLNTCARRPEGTPFP